MADTKRFAATPVQKVVVINGNIDVLATLEMVLDAGRYDMVFVDASGHAYSQIKRVMPHLVILCARLDAPEASQLLTMLKLDPDTRDIPVMTYTLAGEGREFEEAISELTEDEGTLLPLPIDASYELIRQGVDR